jgi:hypothetical protein
MPSDSVVVNIISYVVGLIKKESLLNCLLIYQNIINKEIEVCTLYYGNQVRVGPCVGEGLCWCAGEGFANH